MDSDSEEEQVEVEEVKPQEVYLYLTTEQKILPNNDRTAEMQARLQAEKKKKQMQDEEEEKMKLENQKKIDEAAALKKMKQKELDEKRRLQELKEVEEKEQVANLAGKFGELIADLKNSTSRLELSLTDDYFTPVQYRIIFKCMQINQSVKVLSVNRKQQGDEEGIELAKNLIYNDCLERLDLENNNIGPAFQEVLAVTVARNSTLRTIDLEGNNLTKDNDKNGIICFQESLRDNNSLNCLNLNNCCQTKEAGKKLKEVLKDNTKLINVDVAGNPSLEIDDVREIQSYLERNHNEYLAERKGEWQERKLLKAEKENTSKYEEVRGEEIANIKRIKETAELKQITREEIFLQYAEEQAEERRREEKRLQKEQEERAKKKTRARGGMRR